MTRTARSSSLRAILRDRSESKSGHDKSVRKNGAGPHNWGDFAHEADLEFAAMDDERLEYDEELAVANQGAAIEPEDVSNTPSVISVSAEQVQDAKQFRKTALKDEGINLSTIARTSSAVSGSPPNRIIPIAQDAEIAIQNMNISRKAHTSIAI